MTNFFHATADFFQGLFPVLRAMGRGTNMLFSFLIAFGAFTWIFFGTKYREPKSR
jgi:hypothetical protein